MRTAVTSIAAIGLLFGATVADAGTSNRKRDIPITTTGTTLVRSSTRTAVKVTRARRAAATKPARATAARAPAPNVLLTVDHRSAGGSARLAAPYIPGGAVISHALSGAKKLSGTKTKAAVGGAANMAAAAVPGGTILSSALSGAGKASSSAAALKRPGKKLRRVRFKPGKSLRSVVKVK